MALNKTYIPKILGKFLKSELKDVIKKWGYLNKDGHSIHLNWSGSKNSVINKLSVLLDKQKLPPSAAGELDLLYISRNSSKQLWSVFHLRNEENREENKFSSQADTSDPVKFCEKLNKEINCFMHSDVTVKQISEVLWIRVYFYNDRNKENYIPSNTVYIVHYPHTPFLMMSKMKPSHSKYLINALLQIFSCDSAKDIRLTGHNVHALVKLAIKKYNPGTYDSTLQKKIDNNALATRKKRKREESIAESEPDENIVDECSVNKKQRSEYLDEMFGEEELPALEKLEFKLRTRFQGTKVAQRMKQNKDVFECNVTFYGDNVLEGIRNCANSGIIDSPLNPLLGQVHLKGRNTFKLQSKNVNASVLRPVLSQTPT